VTTRRRESSGNGDLPRYLLAIATATYLPSLLRQQEKQNVEDDLSPLAADGPGYAESAEVRGDLMLILIVLIVLLLGGGGGYYGHGRWGSRGGAGLGLGTMLLLLLLIYALGGLRL
jgi:hypothetical protein